jgi:hypothetical protein
MSGILRRLNNLRTPMSNKRESNCASSVYSLRLRPETFELL